MASGGSERQLAVLANGLQQRGHSVAVAAFYGGGVLQAELLDAVKYVDLRKQGRWSNLRFLMRAVQLVRDLKPDIIHGYGATPNFLALLLRFFSGGSKVVWGIRASAVDLSRYDLTTRCVQRVEGVLSSQADLIVTNSVSGMTHAVAKGFRSERTIVIHNGTDTDRFQPDRINGASLRREWGIPENAALVGMVARLDPMKDHATFLKAAALVYQQRKETRFVCVGRITPAELDQFNQQSHALGLSRAVKWVGERTDLAVVYGSLDLLCLSSVTEALPNVVCEAMACGVPCVVTNVGDAPKIVGETGLVVPARDPAAMASAIIQVLSEGRRLPDPSTRVRIVERYGLARLIDETELALASLECRQGP